MKRFPQPASSRRVIYITDWNRPAMRCSSHVIGFEGEKMSTGHELPTDMHVGT